MLHSSTRNSEKLLEEAQYSGKLLLSNRKLKDIVLCNEKYDLLDVTTIDFSRNGLHDVPDDMCQWYCIKTVILSHNLIRYLPEFLFHLRLIQHLDLGNNQLTHLPPSIGEMKSIIVLRINNNCIVSIPHEIGCLKKCQELDISGNELAAIPSSIGKMEALLHFDFSRNYIQDIPCELCALDLVYLNASENHIMEIPSRIQNMSSLQQLILTDNPLKNPLLKVLKKGRVHFFKSLLMHLQKNSKQDVDLPSNEQVDGIVPEAEFLAQVVNQLSASLDAGDVVGNENKNSFSTSSSPKKRACNTNILESQMSEEHLVIKKPSLEEKVAAAEEFAEKNNSVVISSPTTGPLMVLEKSDKLQGSSDQSVSLENVPRKLSYNRRSSKEAKISLSSSFPGYTPAPVGECHVTVKSDRQSDVAPEEAQFLNVIKPRKAFINRRGPQSDEHLTFTMRRKAEKMYEEMEKLEKLRQGIEKTLKMPLPQNLLPALTDGVILCHLANHVKARSIPTIHVPSPAVPKLSLAKCRRNVDNFLDACIKLGVEKSRLCSASDILYERGVSRLADTVTDLLKLSSNVSDEKFQSPTVRIAPSSTFGS